MSEVFEEYAKIAFAQGLVAKSEERTTEPDIATDKDRAETAQMLYGVKPNDEKKHIVELAHPEPVVVSPAYDRVNGLVENLLERQDIMHFIATKPTHGKHINERYVRAHKELVNTLIRSAFVLDNKGEEDLMVIADNCVAKLNKTAALATMTIGGAIWLASKILVATGLAKTLYNVLSNNIDASEGLIKDVKSLKTEINDIIDEDVKFSSDLGPLLSDLNKLEFWAKKIYHVRLVLRRIIKDIATEADSTAKAELLSGKYDDTILHEFESYREFLEGLLVTLPNFRTTISEAEESYYDEWVDWMPTLVKRVFRGVTPSDFSEGEEAIDVLSKSVREEISRVSENISSFTKLVQTAKGVRANPEKAMKELETEQPEESNENKMSLETLLQPIEE